MIQSKWVTWIAGALIAFLTIGIFVLGLNWMPQENDRVEHVGLELRIRQQFLGTPR